MTFDIRSVPFSRFGSYMLFGMVPPSWGHKGLLLRSVQTSASVRETFHVSLRSGGREIPYRVNATPALCRLESRRGTAEIVFAAPDVARLRGRDVGLRLTSILDRNQYAFPVGEGRWCVNCPASAIQYLVTPLAGDLRVDDVRRITKPAPAKNKAVDRPRVVLDIEPDADGRFECVVQHFVTAPAHRTLRSTFDQDLRGVQREWAAWKRAAPALPARYVKAGEQAMYVNWGAVVAPFGNFKRPTMLMSKNWMTQCWSWDNCFNAIALSYRHPDLAWDQFMIHFDLQDPCGVLPDSADSMRMSWNFCKPPVHGWTLSKLMKVRGLLTPRRLREIYPRLARWTEWWRRERDSDGDGLPEYHHGNDSGWDNATAFDVGFPAAGPDLAAFLVLQMDVLAELAARLERPREQRQWKQRADALLERLIRQLWNGRQFVTRRAFGGEASPEGDSLINFLPIILGRRLPAPQRAALAEALRPDGRFVTRFGPATESPRSPLYVPDGYWRGPIWGPTTVIVADGLARAGFRAQAREIARRHCDMCLASGFAENYDALAGQPLRDPAYTWGSSAFLILAHEFLR